MCWPCCCHDCFIYGGFNSPTGHLTDTSRYDTEGDSWSAVTALPVAVRDMNYAAHSESSWSIGGYYGSGATSIDVIDSVYALDSEGLAWSVKASLPNQIYGGLAISDGSSLDQFGGIKVAYLSTHYAFSGASWSAKTNLPASAGVAENAGDSVTENEMYVFGGFDGASVVSSNNQFNVSGNSWASKTSIPDVRQWHLGVKDSEDLITAAMGNDGTTNQTTNYHYSASGDTFSAVTAVPSPHTRFSGQASPCPSVGYVFCGDEFTPSVNYAKTTRRYDFDSDSWSIKTDTIIGRDALGAATP